MAATDVIAIEPTSPRDRDGAEPRSHAWFIVLLVALAVALPMLLWFGRHQWFFLDEWAFLVNRDLTDVSSMLEPHNGHWVTVPAILYRVDYKVFGLDSYFPYQLPLVLVHLGIVVLLWLTMTRLRVRPVIATFTVLAFVFFGAGEYNILFVFQIALTGSVFCGLAHLLLADHDGPMDRRDFIGLGFGVVGIMCSAVGIPFVIGVAVAVLVRRGWRAAALHAAPLAVLYLAWYVTFARDDGDRYSFGVDTLKFVERMGRAAFVGMGQNGLVGLGLATLAAIGAIVCALRARRDGQIAKLSVVVALLVTFVSFAWLTAIGRVEFGVSNAASGRYIYVAAACFLPLVALGGEVLAGRWVVLGAVPIVLLALGLPGNVDLLDEEEPFLLGSRAVVASIAHSDLLSQLPGDTEVYGLAGTDVSVPAGWLRAAAADGRISVPDGTEPGVRLDADSWIALKQVGKPSEENCPTGPSTVVRRLERGANIAFSGRVGVSVIKGDARSSVKGFDDDAGGLIAVRAGPVDVEISGPLGRPPSICAIG